MSENQGGFSFPPWAVRLIMGMIVRKLQMRQDQEAKLLINFLKGFYKDSSLMLLDCWASSVVGGEMPDHAELSELRYLYENEITNPIFKRLDTIQKKGTE